jgi:hypothetical protein
MEHEEKLRIIYHSKLDKPYYSYTIDPINLYDEVLFDPRMEEKEFIKHKDELIRLGYSKSIEKSTLYTIPNFTLIVID